MQKITHEGGGKFVFVLEAPSPHCLRVFYCFHNEEFKKTGRVHIKVLISLSPEKLEYGSVLVSCTSDIITRGYG